MPTLDSDLGLLGLSVAELQQLIQSKGSALEANKAWRELLDSTYKKLALRWHPDVCKEAEATERMQVINAAHDRLRKVTIRPRPVQQPVFWQQGWANASTSTGTGFWPPGGMFVRIIRFS
jgi:hypothetical protein